MVEYKKYIIEDEDNIPEGLLKAVQEGDYIEVASNIGWLPVTAPEFRVCNAYRVSKQLKGVLDGR